MSRKIYGVDPNKKISTVDVREAIIDCFTKAHSHVMDEGRGILKELTDEQFEEIKQMNVREMIKRIFKQINGNYQNPSKKDLIAVCDALKEFAANFRSPQIIKKHYGEIMSLIERL
jgi:hypothetical protein